MPNAAELGHSQFERHGWRVEAVYLGNPMPHDEKYLLINQAFAGKQRLVPFFNRTNNEDLILAIQSAGVSRGRNGFFLSFAMKALRDNHKDKSGEKLAESEEDLLEHRTDGSDAFSPIRSKLLRGRYPLHRLREIPVPGLLLAVYERRSLKKSFHILHLCQTLFVILRCKNKGKVV